MRDGSDTLQQIGLPIHPDNREYCFGSNQNANNNEKLRRSYSFQMCRYGRMIA